MTTRHNPDARTVVHLPAEVIAEALAMWFGSFRRNERQRMEHMLSLAELDVELAVQVKAEADRLGADHG